jgi:hypothetical protein
VSLERFELLELRRDDGIQTYHARETTTSRPVQVHLFAEGQTRDTLALLAKVSHLPETDRRRVIDRGTFQGTPYVVTDRLAGFASLREWLDAKAKPTVDEEFARLFQPDPVPEPPPDLESAKEPDDDEPDDDEPDDPEPTDPEQPRILALALGVGAAVIFLALLLAFVAFRPH